MTLRLDAPTLTTARLALRAPDERDWEAWAGFAGSERARFVGGPLDREKAWRSFGHAVGHWVLRGFGSFVFTLRGSGAAIGMAGPWYPEGWPEKELGWTVWRPEDEGRGYAFEAAAAARDFAWRRLGWTTAVSYIAAGNARSIALAQRLGAVRDDAAPRNDARNLVYRHPAPEAQP